MKYVFYYNGKSEAVDLGDNSSELFKQYKLVAWLSDNFNLTAEELDRVVECKDAGYYEVNNFPKPANEQQVVYKLRHKHTGLFFDTPDYLLGNLSKTGKVFNTIPSRKGKVTLTKDVAESLGYECVSSTITKSCKLNDWEVISYILTEIKELK